jgi:basic membrane lipoprotein Med (substrate-binding protein (PBP1-ABC) superfamily)
MKKYTWLFTLLAVFALTVGACGSPATPAAVQPATAAPAATTAPEATAMPAAAPFRVAVILPSAKNDMAFSQSMYDALVSIQKEMGGPDKFDFVFSENMFVVDDAAAAARDYASKGYNLVIAHGSQYGSSLQEIAPDFPKTSFAWGTTVDTFGQPNIFAYESAAQEGGYVNGVLAATLSKSKIIGIVAPIETGDAKLYVEGFKLGAAATDPKVKVNVNYIGSFSDVALAAEAATTHISNGADVLSGTAQMVVGAIGKAKESNVLWFASDANQSSLAPSIVVDSQVYHWEVVLKQMISLIQAGTLGGQSFAINLKNSGEVIEYNPDFNLSPDVKALGDKTIQGIIDGTIKINLPK